MSGRNHGAEHNYDWLAVDSGFGCMVSALAERAMGYPAVSAARP